jgi:hypothetical protein
MAGVVLSNDRRGKKTCHLLTGLWRQSVFWRVARYEDVTDADQLGRDSVSHIMEMLLASAYPLHLFSTAAFRNKLSSV